MVLVIRLFSFEWCISVGCVVGDYKKLEGLKQMKVGVRYP